MLRRIMLNPYPPRLFPTNERATLEPILLLSQMAWHYAQRITEASNDDDHTLVV